MQQNKTPMPDLDTFDPNIDPGASRDPGVKRDDAEGVTDEDLPLPPDVRDRESIEEPDPEPAPFRDPNKPQKKIV